VATLFSDFFDVDLDTLDQYRAFDVSIINDLPLFIDPFLLFNSEKQDYHNLHDSILGIVDKLGLSGHKDIVLIDARADNKPSGSKA
jgi:oligoribonuclease (3'-5' exoribonuclease)